MNINEMIYKFKQHYDKLDSQDAPKLENPQIILLLNEAQTKYINIIYGFNNSLKTGFEGDQKRIDDLQILSVKYPDQPYLVPQLVATEPDKQIYTVSLNNLTKTYLHLTRSYSIAHKGDCKNIVIYHTVVTEDDLDTVLIDPNLSPSFEWQEIPVQVSNQKMFLYTDGTFQLDDIAIEYLRYPLQMDIEGYINFEGNNSVNQDCELPDSNQDQIIFVATRIAAGDTDDEIKAKLAEYEVQTSE